MTNGIFDGNVGPPLKLSENLNHIQVFSAVPHPAMFYYCFMEKPNEISLRQILFSKCIKYLIF